MRSNHEEPYHGLHAEMPALDLPVVVQALGVLGTESPSLRPIERRTPQTETLAEQVDGFMLSMRDWMSGHGRLQRHGVLPRDDAHTFTFLSQLHSGVAAAWPQSPLSEQAPVRLGNALYTYKKHCPDNVHPRTDNALTALYERYLSDAMTFREHGFKDVDRMALKYDPKTYSKLLYDYDDHEYIRPNDVRYVFKNLHPKPARALMEMADTMKYIEQVLVPELQARSGHQYRIPRQQIRRCTWNSDPVGDAVKFFNSQNNTLQFPFQKAATLAEEIEMTDGTPYGVQVQDLVALVREKPGTRKLRELSYLDRNALKAILYGHTDAHKQKLASELQVEDLEAYVVQEVIPHYIYLQQRSQESESD